MPTKPRILVAAIARLGGDIRTGKGGHRVVVYRDRKASIPFHGKGFELSDRLVDKILKDLTLSRKDVGLD